MARLREYYYNNGDMLELAKYQKKVLPLAAGAEEVILSATAMFRAERVKRTKLQKEYGKYATAMSGKISLQTNKQMWFYLNGKI